MYLRKILFVSLLAVFASARATFAETGPTEPIQLDSPQIEQKNSSDSSSQTALFPVACFAPGTPDDLIQKIEESFYAQPALAFQVSPRWLETATDGFGLGQGDPTVLTYSFVPDGTFIPGAGNIGDDDSPSTLTEFLDGLHGSTPAWQARFREVFDRWEELTGITFVFEAADDGAAFPGSPGALGVRGDLRIAAHDIDGTDTIVAYNYFPDSGDMVIDTGDPGWFGTENDALRMRNAVAHETGHGIGLSHVCPGNLTKLMEPWLTTAFDGPQHDDTLGAQRLYGDAAEDNNSTGAAADLGLLVGSLELGDVSLDNLTEQDFYAVTMNNPGTISVALSPVGATYFEGPRIDPECTANSLHDSLSVLNLGVQLFDTDGTTVLGNANVNPAGQNESIIDVIIDGAGTYFVRVFATSADDDPKENVQLYSLELIQGESVGQQPNLSPIANAAMDEGTTTSVALVAVDGDGDNIELSVLGLPSFGMLIDNGDGTGALEFAPGFDDNGVYPITVTATDDSAFALTDTEGFVLTVDDANGPPTIDLILDDQVNFDDTIIIHISSTDTDGDVLALSTIGLPAFAMLTDNGDGTGFIEATPSAADAGIHEIEVVVTDDGVGMLEDSTTFFLAVGDFNLAPQIMPLADENVDANDVLIVPITAIDPNDSDVVTLGSIGLPAFAQLNDNGDGTGTVVFSPTLDDVGVYPIIITATDDDGNPLTDTESFLLTVNCVVPVMPSAPAPFSSESGVRPKGVDLTWTAAGGTLDCPETYTVLFGTDRGELTPLCEDIETTSCATGQLKPLTTYFWKVIPLNCCGQNGGPIWQFTTSNIPEILDINTDSFPVIVVTATADTANGPSCALGAEDFAITESGMNQGILDFECTGDGIYTISYETTNPAENGSVREVCLAVDDGGMFIDCENYIAPVGPCDFLEVGGVNVNQFPGNTVLASVFTDLGRACGLVDELLMTHEFMLFEDGVMQEISEVTCAATDGAAVDVVFVFDDSASMDTEIAAMQAGATNFALQLLANNVDARFGLVSFDDDMADAPEFNLQLTDNILAFQAAIDALVAHGGEDPAEVLLDATMMAVNQMAFREVSQKVIILVTDARAHFRGDGSGLSAFTMPEVVDAVKAAGARVVTVSPDFSAPVLAVEAASELETDVRVLAEETGGISLDIDSANFDEIFNQIILLISSTYSITYFSTNPAMDGTVREVCVKVDDPEEGLCINCITYVAPVPNIGPPVVDPIDDQMMFEEDMLMIGVSATDPDNDSLSFELFQAPDFASITDFGDGTAKIVFSPVPGDLGVYTIIVRARDDGFPNLLGQTSFKLTVECVALDPASNPTPAHEEIEVPTTIGLAWEQIDKGEKCPTTYDVFFGTDPSSMTLLCADIETTTCDPGLLEEVTEYFWQVVSKNCCEDVTGPIWSFVTDCEFIDIIQIDIDDFPTIRAEVLVDSPLGNDCGLVESDFMAFEDGEMQEITDFECLQEVTINADVVILFDISGSMGGILDELKDEATAFADEFVAAGGNVQFALMTYGGGPDDGRPTVDLDLTPDVKVFQDAVNATFVDTSGFIEPALESVVFGLTEVSFRPKTKKVFLIITDEFSNDDNISLAAATNEVLDANGIVFALSPDFTFPPFDPSDVDARDFAEDTGGIWIELDPFNPGTIDFSGIADSIISTFGSTFLISYTTPVAVQDSTTRTVTIKVDDPDKGICDDEMVYQAPDPNVPPTINPIPDQEMDENTELLVDMLATDPTHDDLTFTAEGIPNFGVLTDDGLGTATIFFDAGFGSSGEYVITVTVTDDALPNLSDITSFTLTVNNVNRLSPIGDQEMDEGEELNVPLEAQNPDGDTLVFSVDGFPAFGTLNDNGNGTGSIDFAPNFLESGVYPMTVFITDPVALDGPDTETFTLTVNNINRPPLVFPIANVTMRVNETLDVDVTAQDFDNDGLTLTTSATPAFGTFTDHGDGTGTFTFMPGSDDGGFYPMGVTALDDGDPNLFGVNNFILTVQAPPVLAPIADAEMIEEEMLEIPLQAIDPNGDPLILNTVGLPVFGELVDNGDGSGSLLFAPAIGDSGIFEISVTALVPGDALQTDTKMFILTVNGVSGEPVDDLDLSTWIGQPFNNDPAFGGSTFRNGTLGVNSGQGLCMNVGLFGMNGQQWKSPNNIVGLTARTVYRVRTFVSTDQTVQGRVPVWDINYINTQPSGYLNYGGRRWFIDSEGGANAIGIGRDSFDIYIAPSAIDTPQWNGDGALATSAHAFTAEASANTGFRFIYRVLDFDEGLQASERSGTICIEQIIVEAIPLELLNRDVTVLYNTPISTFTHRAYRPSTIVDPLAVAVFDNNNNTLTYRLPSAQAASVDPVVATLGTDINILPVMVLDPTEGVGLVRTAQKFYPVVWESDTLYRGRVAIAATESEFNPVDVLDFTHDVYTAELGGSDWTTSGDRNIGRAGMAGAGSPKRRTTTDPITGGRVPEWHNYFYGNNTTASMISEAKRFRVQLDLFNRGDIGIQSPNAQSGTDELRVYSLEIDRIELDVE